MASIPSKRGCILFDWGDTLMRVYPEYDGKMADWPQVEAVPGAAQALDRLRPDWSLAIATNAEASEEQDIHRALARVGLEARLDAVYCYRRIGHKKPSRPFFEAVLADLGLPAERVWMVGDSFAADIEGALGCGLNGVWFNPSSAEVRRGPRYDTVHRLEDLSGVLAQWEAARRG